MKPQLFLLDETPALIAQSYSDTHLVQYIPILTEVMRAVDAERHPYKNHILVKWCGGSAEYTFVNILVAHMIKELAYRFGVDTDLMLDDLHTLKKHTTKATPRRWLQLIPKPIAKEPIKAYRAFYNTEYQSSTWTKRQVPKWFTGAVQQSLIF